MPISTPGKPRAEDYLAELADLSNGQWLKLLIERILSSRGAPDDLFLTGIYEQFLVEQKLREKKRREVESATMVSVAKRTVAASGFTLKTLKHESGVNALERNAAIPFHSKLTVVYGKNGSGKSGFVRILKRLAGSKTQEEIWQDLHDSKTQNQCKATILYSNGGGDVECQWNGESKIAPFSQMSIFDGKCVPIYLNKNLNFSYQPYGFELFSTLSNALQGLQKRLATDIQSAEAGKPLIGDIFNEGTSIGKFVAGITASTKPENLERLPAWSAKAQRELADKTKKRKDLQNLDQQGELVRTRQQKLKALQNALTQVQTDLSAQNIKIYFALVGKFNQLKKKQTAKKGKTLEDYEIAEMDSNEWEKFIEAGEDYIRIAHDDEYPGDDDLCIYCQQKLSKGAQKLIQLYREIFEEADSSDIDEIEVKLGEALDELEGSSFCKNFPYPKDEFEKLLPKRTVVNAFAALAAAETLAKALAASLRGRKPLRLQPVKTAVIIASIQKARLQLDTDAKMLEDTQRNIFRRSQELDRAIDELKDVQKLAKYRSHVEKYIFLVRWIAAAIPLQTSKLNTKPVTEMAKKAWKELVSESFKHRFQLEAVEFDAPSVDLDFRGEYGLQMRAKHLAGLDGIDRFLSEGEQKAVALADFFAELSMQREHTPVIFDDPATSFDHDRKEKIAKRIVRESETRQLVIFTHDLMFASYLHDRVKDASGNIDSTRAAFHDLRSEANRVGLVTENYYPGSVKFDAYMRKIETKVLTLAQLSGEVRVDGIRSAYGMLRRAVEKAVEEKIFGKVMTRWTEQIQMHNVPHASLSREKLDSARELHGEFSRYIEAHDQSDEMMQHAIPDITKLKSDILQVRDLAVRQK